VTRSRITYAPMPTSTEVHAEIAAAVDAYRADANIADLLDRIERTARAADPATLAAAVEPFRAIPEVAGPAYEHIVAATPDDARALVILANAYWLAGRGPDEVAALASRAIAADPNHRGAWHLWALAEPDLRSRVGRWRQVAGRFPQDQLARANLADNATSLATAEHDREALDLAISTYTELLALCERDEERHALERAIETLRGWRI
jgi:tetratricopeptide (TPR) repeat protein